MSTASNTLEFLYHLILHGQIMLIEYIAGKINQRLGLLNRIKYLLPLSARLFL